MSELKKRLIYFIALIVFFTASPLVVLFAKGARFNFGSREINPTGGIYLKAHDKGDYSVFIDDKKEGNVPLFVSGLKPQSYNLKVREDGYKTWEKKLCVNPFQVTKVRDLYLIPTSPQLKQVKKESLAEAATETPDREGLPNGYYLRGEKVRRLYRKDQKKAKMELILDKINEFKLSPRDNKAFFRTTSGEVGIIWLTNSYWFNKNKSEIDYLKLESARNVQWLKKGTYLVFQKDDRVFLQRVALRRNCNEKEARPVPPRLLVGSVEGFRYDQSEDSLFVKKDGDWFLYKFNKK